MSRPMARAKLIVASSETSADQLYASGFRAPDAFAFLEVRKMKFLLLSDLEVDRGRATAAVDRVDAYSEIERTIQKGKKRPPYPAVLAAWLRSFKATDVLVPSDFPVGLAFALMAEHIHVGAVEGSFWPERETKSAAEITKVTAAQRIAETAMQRAFDVLRASRIAKDRSLLWNGAPLTSETLRAEIEVAIVRAGGEARGDSIVAGGEQACDPHERGSGLLRADVLIILDIFPRDAKTGYFGDITRTVVRGRATDAQRHLWETCLQGQKLALSKMKPGLVGGPVHEEVKAFFAKSGYPTEIRDGRWTGFFHGTGHGLGLEIHESPRFAAATFTPGHVLTVEPGLYIPGLGGVRHEDVAVITNTGRRVLTKLEKPFEI